jgi:hypothetical protein
MMPLEQKTSAELALSIAAMVKAHRVGGIDVSAGLDEHLCALLERPCQSPADALALLSYAQFIHRNLAQNGVDNPDAAAGAAATVSAYLGKVVEYLEAVTGLARESFLSSESITVN